jgi:3-oxoacyl-[acyl-carrier-protein] synthase III
MASTHRARLADAAARECLARAGREASDVDLLINAGVYREDNMGEPALAALVQEDIGANLGHPADGGHGTFSFDLANGACGVISAMHLQAGLLRSGVIRLGLIVAAGRHRGHAAVARPAAFHRAADVRPPFIGGSSSPVGQSPLFRPG